LGDIIAGGQPGGDQAGFVGKWDFSSAIIQNPTVQGPAVFDNDIDLAGRLNFTSSGAYIEADSTANSLFIGSDLLTFNPGSTVDFTGVNITGLVFPPPTFNNVTLTGTTNVNGPLNANAGINFASGSTIAVPSGNANFSGSFGFLPGSSVDFANATVTNLSVNLNNATLTGTTTVAGPLLANGGIQAAGGTSLVVPSGLLTLGGNFAFAPSSAIDFTNATVTGLSVSLNNATLTGTTTTTGPLHANGGVQLSSGGQISVPVGTASFAGSFAFAPASTIDFANATVSGLVLTNATLNGTTTANGSINANAGINLANNSAISVPTGTGLFAGNFAFNPSSTIDFSNAAVSGLNFNNVTLNGTTTTTGLLMTNAGISLASGTALSVPSGTGLLSGNFAFSPSSAIDFSNAAISGLNFNNVTLTGTTTVAGPAFFQSSIGITGGNTLTITGGTLGVDGALQFTPTSQVDFNGALVSGLNNQTLSGTTTLLGPIIANGGIQIANGTAITVPTGSATISGNFNYTPTSNINFNGANVTGFSFNNVTLTGTTTTSGLLLANGDIQLPAGGMISVPTGQASLSGSFGFAAASTVNFANATVTNLSLNNTTLTGTTTTSGLLVANGGVQLPSGGSITIPTGVANLTGSFAFGAASAINFTNATVTGLNNVTLGGTTTTSGLLIANGGVRLPSGGSISVPSGTATFSGSFAFAVGSAVNFANAAVTNLTLNNVTLGGTTTTSGLLIANGGIQLPAGGAIGVSSGTASFNGSFAFGPSSSVNFSNATISGLGNLNLGGTTTIADGTITGGLLFTSATPTLTVSAGNVLLIDGDFDFALASSIDFTNATVTGLFNNVTFTGTTTTSGPLHANGGIVIPSGGVISVPTGTASLSGAFDFLPGSNIDFTNAVVSGLTNFNNVTLTGTTTISGSLVFAAASTANFTNATVTGLSNLSLGGTTTTTGVLTANGGIQVAGGTSLTVPSGTFSLGGAFAFAPLSTINFANATISNLTLNNQTLAGTTTTTGLLVTTSGIQVAGGTALTVASGTFTFGGAFVFAPGTTINFANAAVSNLNLTNETLSGTTTINGSLVFAVASSVNFANATVTNLTLTNQTLAGTTTTTGLLIANGGVQIAGGTTFTVPTGVLTLSGSFGFAASSAVNFANATVTNLALNNQTLTGTTTINGGLIFAAASTANFANATVTNLTLNNQTLGGTTTTSGLLIANGGLQVAGGTSLTVPTGVLILGGSFAFAAGALVNFANATVSNLTLNNQTLTGTTTINGTLAFAVSSAVNFANATVTNLTLTNQTLGGTTTTSGLLIATGGIRLPAGGTISVPTGTATLSGSFNFAASSAIDFTNAVVTGLTNFNNVTLTGTTTVLGPIAMNGGVTIAGGTSLTVPTGVLTLGGSFAFAASSAVNFANATVTNLNLTGATLSGTTTIGGTLVFAPSTAINFTNATVTNLTLTNQTLGGTTTASGLLIANGGLQIAGGNSLTVPTGVLTLSGSFAFAAASAVNFANATVTNLTLNNQTLGGTTTVSGLLIANGGIQVAGGTSLIVPTGTFTLNGAFAFAAASTVNFANATVSNLTLTNQTLSGTTTINGGLVFAPSSTVNFTNAAISNLTLTNQVLGGTTTTSGLLVANGGIQVAGGTSLTVPSGTFTLGGAFAFAAATTINFANATVSNLTLNNQTLTGTTTVNGALVFAAASTVNFTNATVSGLSNLTLGGTTTTSGLLAANGGIQLPSGGSISVPIGTANLTGSFGFGASSAINFTNATVTGLASTSIILTPAAANPTASATALWADSTNSNAIRYGNTGCVVTTPAATVTNGLLIYSGVAGQVTSGGASSATAATLPRPLAITVPSASGDIDAIVATSNTSNGRVLASILNSNVTASTSLAAGMIIGQPLNVTTATWRLASDYSLTGANNFEFFNYGGLGRVMALETTGHTFIKSLALSLVASAPVAPPTGLSVWLNSTGGANRLTVGTTDGYAKLSEINGLTSLVSQAATLSLPSGWSATQNNLVLKFATLSGGTMVSFSTTGAFTGSVAILASATSIAMGNVPAAVPKPASEVRQAVHSFVTGSFVNMMVGITAAGVITLYVPNAGLLGAFNYSVTGITFMYPTVQAP
jgi:hypothetical protein